MIHTANEGTTAMDRRQHVEQTIQIVFESRPSRQNEFLPDSQSLTAKEPASLRALMSRIGGWPKKRLYSRLN